MINRKNRVIVKRLRGEKYDLKFCTPRVQGGGGSAGIWGCISHKGTGCSSIYTGRINQFNYKDTLENSLIPSVDLFYGQSNAWKFMQDGAPAHRANSIKSWFEEKDIELLPWCPRSPDLNPIESIWSWMDRRLVKNQLTSIKYQLEHLWLEIPLEMCMRLIESMPKRVRACYRAAGRHFKA